MPHATADLPMPAVDENEQIQRFLNEGLAGVPGDGGAWDFQPGEKNADAEDYGDVSEDDLPEEEEATGHGTSGTNAIFHQLLDHVAGLPTAPLAPTNGWHAEHDATEHFISDALFEEADNDLFGESFSSPVGERSVEQRLQDHVPQQPAPQTRPAATGLTLPTKSSTLKLPNQAPPGYAQAYSQPRPQGSAQMSPTSMSPPSLQGDGYSPAPSTPRDLSPGSEAARHRKQMELFGISHKHMRGEPAEWLNEEHNDEVFWKLYPRYEEDKVPRFTELFPVKPGKYRGKVPVKPPKPVVPTKLSLDLMPDHERAFKAIAPMGRDTQDATQGQKVVRFPQTSSTQDDSDDELASSAIDAQERIGGVTMQDLALICEDWDIISIDSVSLDGDQQGEERVNDEWDTEEQNRPVKKRKISTLDFNPTVQDPYLRFEDPERAVARVAKTVTLDMNDPHLLLDEHAPAAKRTLRRVPGDLRHDSALGRNMAKRYNISNDEAYDLLKENHQSKIRSTLGSTTLEHALPAVKLQWPFYKVALEGKEKRAFHRQPLELHEPPGRRYRFHKLKYHKKKHVRGREAKDLFAKAEDLSLGDNSNLLVLEYSEEVPSMLSNFGMGNRLVNYYRKRDADDAERPKRDIGEPHVLLNQDKSPFANFGHVDPGETVPALQNGLYRAPVFQHQAKQTDFVLSIAHTFENGSRLYLRPIENLHTVGQQFPLSEVPGEHSRKVTDASKKRLRAISYRIYTKSLDPVRRGPNLTNTVLIRHIPGSDVPQTRSKMREFMAYQRNGKSKNEDTDLGWWVPHQGQQVPDAETIRGWIRPEDVCLLDSMQVGVQHLADLGLSGGKDGDEENAGDDANLEIQLAPWQTSKNFLNACQGKAMLKLHGEGDPTGRGEAFSFIKTSMKGGYIAEGESAADKMAQKNSKEMGGHKYNVATQQAKYDENIRRIWERQKASLSNAMEDSDTEQDIDEQEEPQTAAFRGGTPRTSFASAASQSGWDDSASQFSRQSADRAAGGDKVMIITRVQKDRYGRDEKVPVRVENPRVIALYKKRRMEKMLGMLSHQQMHPTGDPELDALKQQHIQRELARLERNKDRRVAREKAKSRASAAGASPATADSPAASLDIFPGGTDAPPSSTGKGKGRNKDATARKCANCGQVGHIKTNRKLCPMLNGTRKAADAGANGDSSFGAVPAPLTL